MSASSYTVRPFNRSDREQLTALVNAHAQAVVPGVSASVNTVLSQLEREPGEFIVDPWVVGRSTIVAEQRGRIVAAAHLLRYGDDAEVAESYRGAGELRWLLCWPAAPFWPDAAVAGGAVLAAGVQFLRASCVGRIYADGTLPVPGVYGIPEQWPHIQALLREAGFRPGTRTELVFVAEVDALLQAASTPPAGLRVRRTLGINGTRFSALLDDGVVGYVEVSSLVGDVGRLVQQLGWADVGNLQVEAEYRRRGIATWLLTQAAQWLRTGHVDRLLDYCDPKEHEYAAFLRRSGFQQLTETTRGWEHDGG